jgi:negative regulator of replication initiation
MKKYHKTACTNVPEDEHLVFRNTVCGRQYNLIKSLMKNVHFVGSYYIRILPLKVLTQPGLAIP